MVWQSVVIPPLQLIHWALYLLLVIDHSYIHQANFRVFLGDIPMFRRTHFQSKTMNSQLLHLLLLLHQESSLFQATNLAFLGEHPILWLRFLPGDCGQGHSDHPSPPQGRRRSRLSAPCSCPGCRRKQWWFCLGCFEGISAHIRLYIYIYIYIIYLHIYIYIYIYLSIYLLIYFHDVFVYVFILSFGKNFQWNPGRHQGNIQTEVNSPVCFSGYPFFRLAHALCLWPQLEIGIKTACQLQHAR